MRTPNVAETTPPGPSLAAQEASRRNGRNSRGPKTAKGKAMSARNAMKHGLRSTRPILPEGLCQIGVAGCR
jgi:hypothetical protein